MSLKKFKLCRALCYNVIRLHTGLIITDTDSTELCVNIGQDQHHPPPPLLSMIDHNPVPTDFFAKIKMKIEFYFMYFSMFSIEVFMPLYHFENRK